MSTENNKQLIYIFNAIGHCGHFLSWALQNALGYSYYNIVRKDKQFEICSTLEIGKYLCVSSYYLAKCETQEEWDYIIDATGSMKNDGKHMFQSEKIKTLILQNEFRRNLFVNSDDPSILCFLPNGNSYFERVAVKRFDRQETFNPPVAISGVNKYCIELNLEDMIFNKNYDFVEYITDPVDIDKLHTSMLYWDEFIRSSP
tara:strand:- start:360 stop:962 length:603 start_codon:yes stop_codon:yes gene_type:complete